ncbi:MAG: DbpA RNA binding domain-containing protein [Spirochaetales bacterium]|nr:DbpA RNA binding domain-containing protein [Spirochaetales bacterium]
MLVKKKISNHKIHKYLLFIIKNSGFHGVSELQRKAVPKIMRKRHLMVSAGEQRGKTSLLFLPEIFSNEYKRFAVIITPDIPTINKIKSQYETYSREYFHFPEIITVSNNEVVLSREYRKHLLICTARDYISLVRSAGIKSRKVARIYFTDNSHKQIKQAYLKDMEFILAKKHKKTGTTFVFRFIDNEVIKSAKHFIRTIRILDTSKNMFHQHLVFLAPVTSNHSKRRSLFYILSTYGNTANIFCDNPEEVKSLLSTKFSENYASKHNYYNVEDLSKIPCSDNLNINIIYDFKSASNFLNAVDFSKAAGLFFIIHTADEVETLNIFKEQKNIQMKKLKETDVKLIERNIEDILKIIQEEADPDLLNEYKKIIKKNVKLHLRGYLTAYLFMNANTKNIKPRSIKLEENKNRASREKSREKTPREPNPDMTALFVSIGKNRRVFPKDLANLFASTLEVDKSEIGDIKILDNYSFVEVPNNLAELAIEKLNKQLFRKTSISVNYSKSK